MTTVCDLVLFATHPHLYYNAVTVSKGGQKTLEEQYPQGMQAEPFHSSDGERVSLARAFGGPSLLREALETILLTLIILLVVKTTIARFQVHGSSMDPTLDSGQCLVISKLTYWIHPPERGDIIVFRPPNRPAEDYIKRIVGLPEEQVDIKDGEVRVDGVLLNEPYVANLGHYSGSWSLGDDDYFVLGDNRSNSSDSHTWGSIPQANIVGKAALCYWPLKEWGTAEHYIFPEPAYQEE